MSGERQFVALPQTGRSQFIALLLSLMLFALSIAAVARYAAPGDARRTEYALFSAEIMPLLPLMAISASLFVGPRTLLNIFFWPGAMFEAYRGFFAKWGPRVRRNWLNLLACIFLISALLNVLLIFWR